MLMIFRERERGRGKERAKQISDFVLSVEMPGTQSLVHLYQFWYTNDLFIIILEYSKRNIEMGASTVIFIPPEAATVMRCSYSTSNLNCSVPIQL